MYYLFSFLLLVLLSGCKEESLPVAPEPDPYEKPELPEFVVHELSSVYVNDNYPLQVYLPADYTESMDSLPVIYILDGNSRFSVIVDLVVELSINSIVVGIGNNKMRDRDYMPANTCASGGGGHTNYYRFLSRELIPFIDTTYRTDRKNRTLAGHSFSGAMALIALFSDNPENPLINSYIANDPSILCAPHFFFSLFPVKRSTNTPHAIKLHISKSFQNTVDLYMFATKLESLEYEWLNLDWREFTTDDHNTILRPSFKAGLNFIFGG